VGEAALPEAATPRTSSLAGVAKKVHGENMIAAEDMAQ